MTVGAAALMDYGMAKTSARGAISESRLGAAKSSASGAESESPTVSVSAGGC